MFNKSHTLSMIPPVEDHLNRMPTNFQGTVRRELANSVQATVDDVISTWLRRVMQKITAPTPTTTQNGSTEFPPNKHEKRVVRLPDDAMDSECQSKLRKRKPHKTKARCQHNTNGQHSRSADFLLSADFYLNRNTGKNTTPAKSEFNRRIILDCAEYTAT